MNKIETVISVMDTQIPLLMKDNSIDKEGATIAFLDWVVFSYLKNENDIDVLDLALAFTLAGKKWQKYINIKVFHDIYYSNFFKEVEEDVMGYSDGVCLMMNLPTGLAEKYLDHLYKKGEEDTETFLWRCLCLGCMPNEKFLRMSEEQKHDVFTKEIGWVLFEELFELSEEDVEMAIDLSSYSIEISDADPNARAEA